MKRFLRKPKRILTCIGIVLDQQVTEKRRIIWCDYAAAFQAALECVNTPQSQDFAAKYIPKGLPSFCGEGDPPSAPYGHGPPPPGSAWDDWCGANRRKGNHPAEDQTKFFQIAIRSAAKLVIHALNRGSAELIDALDVALDPTSPIYAFSRESNREAHQRALQLHNEVVQLWRDEGGPNKRLALLDKAPWRSLLSMVKGMDSIGEYSDSSPSTILDRVANRLEEADAKELEHAGKSCMELIHHFSKENQPQQQSPSLIKGFFSTNSNPRKQFKQRLKAALRQIALRATKSGVWAIRRAALEFLEHVVKRDKEYKENNGSASCAWLEENQVIEDLFGERAHATIVSESVSLLSLIDLNEARLNVILDSALMHVGSVRAEVQKVIMAILKDLDKKGTRYVLDRVMEMFPEVPSVLQSGEASPGGGASATRPSSSTLLNSLKRGGSDCLQAAFELVTAIFDTSKLHGLYTTVDVMMKGRKVATRAMDVLVAALLSPFCEDPELFAKLVQDSLFHCLQSTWGEVDGSAGQGKLCKDHVLDLCCNIVKDPSASQRAIKGAFAVLMEVIRLFPRNNFAQRGDKTREACIHGLQEKYDVVQACMTNLGSLSKTMDRSIMDSDEVLNTQLWTRLLQLRYLLENASEKEYNLSLDTRQIDLLWEALGGCTEACLRWLRLAADSGGIFDENVAEYLFDRYICRMDPVAMRAHGFNCYQAFFADVNNISNSWRASGRDGQKSGCKINGASFVGRRVRVLWKDEKMHNGTICHYMPPNNRADPKVQRHTVRWDDTGKEDTHDWTDLHDWHLLEDELSVNILPYEIKAIHKPDSLAGMELLWGAALHSHDDLVANKAAMMLLDLARHMPADFQNTVLVKIFGSQSASGVLEQAVGGKSDEGRLRVRRCLELVQSLLKGQLRICENIFSYTQVTQSRAHGFCGRGKVMTIQIHVKEDAYKAQTRAVKVHSRQALDEVLGTNFPNLQGEAARFVVTLNGTPLVRGPNTTLEELGVKHGAELKLEYDKPQPQLQMAAGSIADTIARDAHYYQVLLGMMDSSEVPVDVKMLVWEVLMTLPTLAEEATRIRRHEGNWEEALNRSLWHSLYSLQIVDAQILPHGSSKLAEQGASSFLCTFLGNRGMPAVVRLEEQLHMSLSQLGTDDAAEHQKSMLLSIGLPIVIRVMRLCATSEVVQQGGRGGSLARMQLGDPWQVVGKMMELVIMLGSSKRAPVDTMVDACKVLTASLASELTDPGQVESLDGFFAPRPLNDLQRLGLGDLEVQEGSKMASDAGVLVHRILLNNTELAVRSAVSEVLFEMAKVTPASGDRVVSLMSDCLSSAHSQCTTCKQFFLLLTKLLLDAQYTTKQGEHARKTLMLVSALLRSADTVTLAPEMLLELMVLMHQLMQRPAILPAADVAKSAEELVEKLYNVFLVRMPNHPRNLSARLSVRTSFGASPLQMVPLCEKHEMRAAAWALLLTAVTQYAPSLMKSLSDKIASFTMATRLPVKVSWNRLNPTPKEDWEHKATVERRRLACVGLKNQGATCYMNAMMQQLFLDDSLRKCVLTAPLAAPPPAEAEEMWHCPICTLENTWDSRVCVACEQGERPERVDPVPHGDLLRQLQRTFRFMVDSEMQSFDPIQLVEACRDLGLHFRVTSQNDSSEFFDKLLERLEREVGGKEHQEVLKSCFSVRVSSQLVSVECPHRKPVNAGVFEKSFKVNVERMGTLEKAIEDQLAGELMTGDSRVDCEQCTLQAQQEALRTGATHEGPIKRAMRRTLFLDGENMPETLCVQMNRFQFQGNGFVKLNDRLAFPMILNLAPYTKPPPSSFEGESGEDGEGDCEGGAGMLLEGDDALYELKGIVVHSGQFSFGHYYSFAKDPLSGKWLKLDDDQVSEFDLADLESECFGGIQTTVNKWTNCVYKTEKTASAYMLFYQRKDSVVATPQRESKSGATARFDQGVSDGMEAVHIDEESVGEPPSPAQVEAAAGVDEILDTNEQMLRRAVLFDDGFSSFTLDFVLAIQQMRGQLTAEEFSMALSVFYRSVLHSELHPRMNKLPDGSQVDWFSTLMSLLSQSPQHCASFIRMTIRAEGGTDELPSPLEGGVVCCPVEEVRTVFCSLLCHAVRTLGARMRDIPEALNLLADLVDAIIAAIPAASHAWRHMGNFGAVLEALTQVSQQVRDIMRSKDVVGLLLHLYLGPKSPGIPNLVKLAAMGSTNSWQSNGRSDPDFDSVLRTLSLLLKGDPPLPRMSESMINAGSRPVAVRLCESDPMGGFGLDSEPLLFEMCRRAEPKLLSDAATNLISQLDKNSNDPPGRVRQSQAAQVVVHFLAIDAADTKWGNQTRWRGCVTQEQVHGIREQVVTQWLEWMRSSGGNEAGTTQDRLRPITRNLLTAKRHAQTLVLAGTDSRAARLMAERVDQWEWLSQYLSENLACSPVAAPKQTRDANAVLTAMAQIFTHARSQHLPSELLLASPDPLFTNIKGVFRPEPAAGAHTVSDTMAPAPLYCRMVDSTTSLTLAKIIVGADLPIPGSALQMWAISQTVGAGPAVAMAMTAQCPACPDKFPSAVAEWRLVPEAARALPIEMILAGGLGAPVQVTVLAQWGDDGVYPRNRGVEYSTGGGEQVARMNTGSSRQVQSDPAR